MPRARKVLKAVRDAKENKVAARAGTKEALSNAQAKAWSAKNKKKEL